MLEKTYFYNATYTTEEYKQHFAYGTVEGRKGAVLAMDKVKEMIKASSPEETTNINILQFNKV